MLKFILMLGVSAALVGCSSGDNSSTSTSGSSGTTGTTTGGSTAGSTTGGSGTTSSGSTSGASTGGSTGSTASCSVVGTFQHTLPNGGTASFVTSGTEDSGTFVLSIVVSTNTTTIDGNYTVSGTQVTMTNTASSPASVNGCIGEAAVYNLVWSTDCSQVTFHKVSDTCTGRIGDADGSTLTRQ